MPWIESNIERDNIGGLGKEIDLLKDLHVMVFNKIVKQAWQTAIKAINKHLGKSVSLFAKQRMKVLGTTSLEGILDLRSVRLKPLAEATTNTKFACTKFAWETDSSYKYGFCSIFQSGPGLKAAGVK